MSDRITVTLLHSIEADMKTAMKTKAIVRLATLRMLISAIRMLEMEKKVSPIPDEDVIRVIQKQAKQRKESIVQFEAGNRQDLANNEKLELTILEAYLPVRLTDTELEEIVKLTITELSAKTKSDTGRVMKAVMEKVSGRTDGAAVMGIVQQQLT